MKRPLISIVSPCFNEEDNVEACYTAVRTLFDAGGPLDVFEYEHIFADNSSSDSTVSILRRIAGADGRVRVIVNSRNYGPFRSTFNALRHAGGDAVVPMLPVDLQDPVAMIVTFVTKWQEGFLRVYGIRAQRAEGPMMRFARATYYRLVSLLSNVEIAPGVAEFQILDRSIVAALLRHHDHYPYIRGLIAQVGFAAQSLGIEYRWVERRSGFSKNRLSNLIDQGLNGIISTASAPLRLAMGAGLLLSLLSAIYVFIYLVTGLLSTDFVFSGMAVAMALLFFLSGIQLFVLGLLGEYVSSIHAQVRRGDIVVERELINMPGRVSEGRDLPVSRRDRRSDEI